jgi:hypothetical protein
MPESDIIYSYTRQQAIDDGIFVDVSRVAQSCGFIIPVALTSNLYHSHIKKEEETDTNRRLISFLLLMYSRIQDKKNQKDNMLTTKICFADTTMTDVWAVVEGTSPTDPSPAMNIMLPEDY